MEILRKTIRATSQLFTLGMLIFCIFQITRKIEQIYVIDIVLCMFMTLIIVLGIVLSKNLSLHSKLLNFLIPYVLVMILLFAGVYLVNYTNISRYIDFKIIGIGFTGGYIIYSLVSLYLIRKDRNRIHF